MIKVTNLSKVFRTEEIETTALMLLIALLSICWQMIKLMNTNPVKSLKAE